MHFLPSQVWHLGLVFLELSQITPGDFLLPLGVKLNAINYFLSFYSIWTGYSPTFPPVKNVLQNLFLREFTRIAFPRFQNIVMFVKCKQILSFINTYRKGH